MPLNARGDNLLGGVALLRGVNRDLLIPWQDFYLASASLSNFAASLSITTLSGCNLTALRITATVTTCPMWITRPVPNDIALSGATVAAGSGLLILDWTDGTTAAAIAKIAACLYLVPNGSAINDAGASLIGSACVSITGNSASEFVSSSIMQFNAPTTRDAFLVLKLQHCPTDSADTSGSNFHLFSARLRYLADRIGSPQ